MRTAPATPAVGALAMGLCASAPLLAQSPYRSTGKEMPLHDAVSESFSGGYTLCTSDENSCQDFMTLLGIPLDSPVTKVLRSSLEQYGKLIKWGPSGPKTITRKADGNRSEVTLVGTTFPTPGVALEGSSEQRSAVIMKPETDKARSLGRIYRDLRNSMTSAGISCETLDAFIENTSRPGLGVVSDEPFDEKSHIRQTARAFDGGFTEPSPPQD